MRVFEKMYVRVAKKLNIQNGGLPHGKMVENRKICITKIYAEYIIIKDISTREFKLRELESSGN